MLNIGVIGPKDSIENIEKAISDLDFNFNINNYIYTDLNNLTDIYHQNINNWDYILCSGILIYTYLIHNIKSIPIPINYIYTSNDHFYGMIINYLLKNPAQSLTRIYLDFSGEINNFIGLKKFIKTKQLPKHNSQLDLSLNKFNNIDFDNFHQKTAAEIKNLWDNKEIDFVFTRMPKISHFLNDQNIPHKLISPPKKNIINSFKNINKEIKFNLLQEKKTGIFYIDLDIKDENNFNENEYKEITMHKILVDFRKDNNLNLDLAKTYNGFKITFKRKYINNEDNKFKLINYIDKNYNYNYNIGVGFGITINDALFYAYKGLSESKNYGKNTAFFVDSDYNVFGPLSKDESIKYKFPNDILKYYAKKMSINPTNLSRIISLSQNNIDELNSNLVQKYTNITKRSANRILSKLSKNDIIIFTEKKKLKKGKGRPTKVYKINKEHKIYLSLINDMNLLSN